MEFRKATQEEMAFINQFSIWPSLTKSGRRVYPKIDPKFEDIPDGSVITNRTFVSGVTSVLRVVRNFKKR